MGLADFATVKNKDREKFPGPGQYTPRDGLGTVKREHVTIKGRGKDSTNPNSPRTAIPTGTSEEVGPGKYYREQGPSGPAFSIAAPHSTGATKPRETDLGPAYSPRQYQMATDPHGPKFSISFKTRGSGAPLTDNPGPEYNLPSTLSQKGVSLAGKTSQSPRRTENGETAPGPGAYQVERFGDRVAKPRNIPIHHSGRTERPEDEVGPGKYVIDQHTIAAKTTPRDRVACAFGGRNFPPLPTPCGAPGPAAYGESEKMKVSWSTLETRKGKTMGTKPAESSEIDAIYPRPGPGDYDIPSTFNSGGTKGFSFGQKIAQWQSKNTQPGPQDKNINVTQYSLAAEIAKDPKGFRFAGRSKQFDKSESARAKSEWRTKKVDGPGPASYDPKPIGPTPPAFSMTAREHGGGLFMDTGTQGPGPGTYNIKDDRDVGKAPIFYKGSFADSRAGNDVPGPGAYNDREAFETTKPKREIGFTVHPPPPQPGSVRRMTPRA